MQPQLEWSKNRLTNLQVIFFLTDKVCQLGSRFDANGDSRVEPPDPSKAARFLPLAETKVAFSVRHAKIQTTEMPISCRMFGSDQLYAPPQLKTSLGPEISECPLQRLAI
jgi:hypothetical protein